MEIGLQETYYRILGQADSLFKKFGIRSVSMDDIAKELHISKKTIYLHYSNKADIVRGIMTEHIESEKRDFEEIHGKSGDALEEMILMMNWVSKSFKDINPALIYDVQKYYPKSWEIWQEFKNSFIRKSVTANLIWGKEQGLYRPDLDVNIIAKLRLDEVEFFLDPSVFEGQKYDLTYVHLQLLEHYIHGLVTMKGKKLLNDYLNKDNNP